MNDKIKYLRLFEVSPSEEMLKSIKNPVPYVWYDVPNKKVIYKSRNLPLWSFNYQPIDCTDNIRINNNVNASLSGHNGLYEDYDNTLINCKKMFEDCIGLTKLDLRNFDTANVTTMIRMFSNCSELTTLDLSNFDTSNVFDMSFMFQGCSGLTKLDISELDTSNVTYMSNMFYCCSGLTTLDLSNFKTSNVTDMSFMFQDCSGLTTLNLSGWDTSKANVLFGMFMGCSSLTSIKAIGCNQTTINMLNQAIAEAGITCTLITE